METRQCSCLQLRSCLSLTTQHTVLFRASVLRADSCCRPPRASTEPPGTEQPTASSSKQHVEPPMQSAACSMAGEQHGWAGDVQCSSIRVAFACCTSRLVARGTALLQAACMQQMARLAGGVLLDSSNDALRSKSGGQFAHLWSFHCMFRFPAQLVHQQARTTSGDVHLSAGLCATRAGVLARPWPLQPVVLLLARRTSCLTCVRLAVSVSSHGSWLWQLVTGA